MKRNVAAASMVTALLFSVAAARAEVSLASVFKDGMVMQREKPLVVWGQADAKATVTVTLAGQKREVRADAAGNWEATFEPLRVATDPIVLEATSEGKTARAADILVGDVWLCSGQSNMQMSVKETVGGAEAAAKAGEYRLLRFGKVGNAWTDTPQTKADVKWGRATPETAADFTAAGYYFAAELLADPKLANVPIGMLESCLGGTAIEGWTPAAGLAGLGEREIDGSMFGIRQATLYNGMIAPLGPGPIRGVLWYQGEANSGRPELYARKLKSMMAGWREQFGDPTLPFVIVSLPDFSGRWNNFDWSWIREAQQRAADETPGAMLALAINTNDGGDLHPREKREIGRRAALLVRHDVYGSDVVARGPRMASATPEGGKIRVRFDTKGDGLVNGAKGPVAGFSLAGDDGRYYYADAAIDGESVVVSSPFVPAPRTVRYAWAGVPKSTLTNRSGLPAFPFRTDSQPAANPEFSAEKPGRKFATPKYEAVVNADGMVESLRVGGKQFLSFDAGVSGGTTIPYIFGARSLHDIRELGPTSLSCNDPDVTLVLDFAEAMTRWTVTNRGKDEIRFRVALAANVKVSGSAPGTPIVLTRGKPAVTIAGVEKVSEGDDPVVLEVAIPPGQSRKLELTFGGT